ncbi:zinc finger protein SNAI1 [Tribolium castaneum]|uniref:C2H2-type domain-containing protein n=1 Tax=Tribolium castaneum TaxID=7070 RepID=D2A550_TRICA|nr:PREDICTED: zinc finger protein SNAI1 [Tribolium castaneum]EFA05315.1 hypothetical protein TcasGA2_TC015473 [Tribolium castaneum]|eukprot:XP_970733.3 PREDICTED: zinc finger protein SNAI1 [Tribolium castaneum]
MFDRVSNITQLLSISDWNYDNIKPGFTMNFTPFGGHFPTTIPTIHQFAAKFSQENNSTALCPTQENNSNRYTANGVPSFTQHHPPTQQQMINTTKYQPNYMNQTIYHQNNVRQEKRQGYEHQELAQELCAAMLNNPQADKPDKNKQEPQENNRQPHQQLQPNQQQPATSMPSSWQSLATPGSTVADYLSHLPASTLPLSLHHFLKYSAETIKKESAQQPDPNPAILPPQPAANLPPAPAQPPKKKKKKKPEKEKKPRPKPGEIRLTTALDGSTLYCCPECHMAYPEKELLEQHLVGHTLERRFVCDICGAGLKRKDHLTRHKQSHNPERPYVCTVCLKAFKRKEQLTLHFVIHSGEKRHICTECGKGFYRKDHLRKHTRSHIARRVKAELSQQGNSQALQLQMAAPATSNSVSQGILS